MPNNTFVVAADEAEGRLDKYLKKKIPGLTQSLLEKSLRKGDVRVNRTKAKSNVRLEEGDEVMISEFLLKYEDRRRAPKKKEPLTSEDIKLIRSMVIYEGPDFWALNKPAGLATQGGTNTTQHVDRLLPGLVEKGEPTPKLVHRLDKNTSGVMLVAKTAKAAQRLGKAFAGKSVEKIYWALVVGEPSISEGKIDMPISKLPDPKGEKMRVDYEDGQQAVTYYQLVERLGGKLSWLELMPATGRTHQLRVHCMEALQTPIVGDGKYGGQEAFPFGRVPMHLHARSLTLDLPGGKPLTIRADLPPHMKKTWKEMGLELNAGSS